MAARRWRFECEFGHSRDCHWAGWCIGCREEGRRRVPIRVREVGGFRQAHAFRSPVPHRYEPDVIVDHLDAPGDECEAFPGCVL